MRRDGLVLPVAETSLAHYFGNRLAQYARRLRPPPQEDTCWYLGDLLDRMGRSERLFSYEDDQLILRPLAQLYGDAREAASERERCLLLQQLGDLALFLGALFPERYARHGIGRDYFVGMGEAAYDYLAGSARRNRHVFAELARTFGRVLDMVADACSRNRPVSDADVVALYRRWLQDGDPAAARQLTALGIALGGQRLH